MLEGTQDWALLESEFVGRRPAPKAFLTCQMLELQHVMLNLNLSVRDIILFPSLFCPQRSSLLPRGWHPAAQLVPQWSREPQLR